MTEPPPPIVEENAHVSRAFPGPAPDRAPEAFHRSMPGYRRTLLRDQPGLAEELGVGRLWLKDETERFGLPAFKIAGASWAAGQALRVRLGLPACAAASWEALLATLDREAPPTLVTATDGNHGRAIARVARWLGLRSKIVVPSDMVAARRAAIAAEGAEVTVVDGGYDDAVARAAASEDEAHVVVSDTSWEGYEDTPRAVVAGYSTVLWEVEDGLRGAGEPDPDVVVVLVGVGSFAAAVVRHYRAREIPRPPRLIAVEPTRAACALASAREGAPVTVPGPHNSIMSGLNCGTPSRVAWPDLRAGIDMFAAVDDEVARDGMRRLAVAGIAAGECSGGAVGAVRSLRRHGRLAADATVLTFLTEGVTDPKGYAAIVGRPPEAVEGQRQV